MQYIQYCEVKKRGTTDFPIEFYHVEEAHPQYKMPYHWHIEFEIIRILSGSFSLTIEDLYFTARTGDFVLIPASFLHAGIPDSCVYECVVFDINMLLFRNDSCLKYLKQISSHEIHTRIHFTASDNLLHQTVWTMFHALAEKKSGYQLLVLGCLFQLFGLIITGQDYTSAASDTSRSHRRIQKLRQVLEYIEASYQKPITLEQLSRCAGMSPKYFCRFFHEMTHYTPMNYVNYYRIERACYQLVTTDFSITEIAYNSGFNDLSYFIKTFRKYKGITPRRYLS